MLPTLNYQEVSQEVRERAKMMYLAQYSLEEIVIKLNINLNVLKEWVFGKDGKGTSASCWNVVRSQVSDCSITAYILSKQDVFERTTGLALNCLTKALEGLNKRVNEGQELDVDEIHKISSVIEKMDKINRLEAGRATAIVHNTGLTPEKVREIIKNDPIADVVDVEYKELEDI